MNMLLRHKTSYRQLYLPEILFYSNNFDVDGVQHICFGTDHSDFLLALIAPIVSQRQQHIFSISFFFFFNLTPNANQSEDGSRDLREILLIPTWEARRIPFKTVFSCSTY